LTDVEHEALVLGGTAALRNEPIQLRSSARIESLLDAAAQVVDEVGYERLTTAMIAEKADASIGTVYRYFPERLAVLRALRNRHLSRYMERLSAVFDTENTGFLGAADETVNVYISMFRDEPGFRAIRFSDMGNETLNPEEESTNGVLARYFVQRYLGQFDPTIEADLVFRLEVVVEVGEALMSRAFADPNAEDSRFIEEYREFTQLYIKRHIVDRYFADMTI